MSQKSNGHGVQTDTGPFALVPLWVQEQLTGSAGASAIVVYVALHRWTGRDRDCWPSHQAIADATGFSVATVKRALGQLEHIGALIITPRFVDGEGKERTSNHYRIVTVRSSMSGGQVMGEPTSGHGWTDPSGHGWTSNHIHTEPDPMNQLTHAIEQVEVVEVVPEWETLFAEFWSNYPRKIGKQNAAKAFKRLSKTDRQAALDALGGHVMAWKNSKTEPRFIPHAATWLNGQRFNDDLRAVMDTESDVSKVIRFAREARKVQRNGDARGISSAGVVGGSHPGLE